MNDRILKSRNPSGTARSSYHHDHRQTIVSPVSKERNVVLAKQLVEEVAVERRITSSKSAASVPERKPRKKSSSGRSRRSSGGRGKTRKSKPPLCKHPRSVNSQHTSTTYVSSDESDDGSNYSGSGYSGSVHSGISSKNSARKAVAAVVPAESSSPSSSNSHALVPFQQSSKHEQRFLKQQDSNRNVRLALSNSSDDLAEYNYHNSYSDNERHNAYVVSDSEDDEQDQAVSNDPQEDVFGIYSSEEDDSLADLDALIAESSARWKQDVVSTVKQTVTGNFTSTTLQQLHNSSSSSFEQATASSLQEDSAASTSKNTPSRSNSASTQRANNVSTSSTKKQQPAQRPKKQLIQEQQAEIEALRSALQQLPSSSEPAVVPLHTIEVGKHTHADVHDDLTEWSGFQATTTTRHVSGLSIALQSSVSGVTRQAVYTGTLLNNDNCNSITGTGTLQFEATGDIYTGELWQSEMHGSGSYSIAKTRKVLTGTFEHNVFVG